MYSNFPTQKPFRDYYLIIVLEIHQHSVLSYSSHYNWLSRSNWRIYFKCVITELYSIKIVVCSKCRSIVATDAAVQWISFIKRHVLRFNAVEMIFDTWQHGNHSLTGCWWLLHERLLIDCANIYCHLLPMLTLFSLSNCCMRFVWALDSCALCKLAQTGNHIDADASPRNFHRAHWQQLCFIICL